MLRFFQRILPVFFLLAAPCVNASQGDPAEPFKFVQRLGSVRIGGLLTSPLYVRKISVTGEEDGSMTVSFSINDGYFNDSYTHPVLLSAKDVAQMPKGLFFNLTHNRRLSNEEALYLLNHYTLSNTGTPVGSLILNSDKNRFYVDIPGARNSKNVLDFVVQAVRDGDQLILGDMHDKQSTFTPEIFASLEGKNLVYNELQPIDSPGHLTVFNSLPSGPDFGYCTTDQDYKTTFYDRDNYPVLNAVLHCSAVYDNVAKEYCFSKRIHPTQNCTVELRPLRIPERPPTEAATR